MSTSEILDQLSKLDRSERQEVWQRLEELELADVDETPEMLAAIEAGRAAVRNGKTHTPDEARQLIAKWTTKLS
jgi:predicted transcriptional regulator